MAKNRGRMVSDEDSKKGPVPYMGSTKKGMHTKAKGLFEQLKMAEKAIEMAREEMELLGDETSIDKFEKARGKWYDLYIRAPKGLSYKAHVGPEPKKQKKKSSKDSKMGGGKVKKNYSRGGGVRAAKY